MIRAYWRKHLRAQGAKGPKKPKGPRALSPLSGSAIAWGVNPPLQWFPYIPVTTCCAMQHVPDHTCRGLHRNKHHLGAARGPPEAHGQSQASMEHHVSVATPQEDQGLTPDRAPDRAPGSCVTSLL